MNIVLWIVQGLLAFAFLAVGFNHAFRPEKMAVTPRMQWIKAVPPKLMTFIGIAEMAGALGIVLPILTGVLPWLTPLAAASLALVMALAFGFHLSRKEYQNLIGNAMFVALAAFVAWGRWDLF